MADPTLAKALDAYRGALDDSLDGAARRRLLRRFRRGMEALQDELEALQARIRTAPRIPIITGTGGTTTGIPPSWLFQEARYLSLQRQAAEMMDGMTSDLISGTIESRARAYHAGIEAGRTSAERFIPNLDVGSWASVPRNAIESFLGASSAGPLAALFSSFRLQSGAAAEGFIRSTIAGGLLQGRSLFRVASELESGLYGISASRALTITRTETLRAYRQGSFEAWKANGRSVRSWVWRAAVSNSERPPCPACFARHGQEFPMEAHGPDAPAGGPMETHPNCRCVMVPQRKEVAGLRPSGPGSTIEPLGRAAFDRLSPDVQRRILGPTRLGMYRRGEIAFSDFAGVRSSARWGANRAAVTPIRELRAMSGEVRTIRRASEDRILRDIGAEPVISRALAEIEGELDGGRLAGYQYRVKTFESTARKVEKEIAESSLPLTPEAAAGGLKDTLRFTYELRDATYADDALHVLQRLEGSGFQRIKWAPTWEGAGYKGLNSAWIEPTTGRVFELQFHTSRSLIVKETISHPLYEAQRRFATASADWNRLQRQIDEAWASVAIPPNIRRLYFG